MSITHDFVSAKSDGGDATLVKPSHWNASHVVTGLTYAVPVPVQQPAGVFTSGVTTCGVTMTAPTVGNRLLMFVHAAGRVANSITQTNVAWTKLLTSNGNGFYCEIWAGVISASPGTTATVNFTGNNTQYCQAIELDSSYPAFTTAGTPNANTAASGTLYNVGPLTTANGDYVVWMVTAGQASSYSILNHPYLPLTAFGGFGRAGFFRSAGGDVALMSVNVASNAWRGLLVVIS